MYIATSHPSLRDKVSAAIVECTALYFWWVQYNDQVWFFESVIKIICPAWLPSLGKLLKQTSVNSSIFSVFKYFSLAKQLVQVLILLLFMHNM